jgi:hypothetical protein
MSRSEGLVDQIKSDEKQYDIRLEQDLLFAYSNTVRPIIKNSIGESSCVGPKFSGILSVEQNYSQLIPQLAKDKYQVRL